MTYNSQIIASKAGHKSVEIHLVRGKSLEGIPIYTYLAVYKHRVRDLKLSLMRSTTELEKYGVILESGFGEPDKATQEYIRKTYLIGDIQESEN